MDAVNEGNFDSQSTNITFYITFGVLIFISVWFIGYQIILQLKAIDLEEENSKRLVRKSMSFKDEGSDESEQKLTLLTIQNTKSNKFIGMDMWSFDANAFDISKFVILDEEETSATNTNLIKFGKKYTSDGHRGVKKTPQSKLSMTHCGSTIDKLLDSHELFENRWDSVTTIASSPPEVRVRRITKQVRFQED